ncbi:MAG: zinc ABC transporter substrate-binding protein [Pseudomonadota bacterium]
MKFNHCLRIPLMVLTLILVSAVLTPVLAAEKLSVFVSIEPQAYLVERIGQDKVVVSVLVPPGKSPETYSPKPGQMKDLARAQILFTIGVEFEQALVPRISGVNEGITLVDTTQGITPRTFPDGGRDPHIWMSPRLAAIQSETMCNALGHARPEYRSFFQANLEVLKQDLVRLDQTLATAFEPIRGQALMVFHPVFGYLADDYGLVQMAVEKEGKAPKGKDLVRFIQQAQEKRARVIFVQPQFDTNTAQKVASAIGGVVIPLDPLARNYIQNLESIAVTIRNALQ